MKKYFIGITIGCALTISTTSLAEPIKNYILTKVEYPIQVNDKYYSSAELPVLSYEGSTYVPLKAFGEIFDSKVVWEDKMVKIISNSRLVDINLSFAERYEKKGINLVSVKRLNMFFNARSNGTKDYTKYSFYLERSPIEHSNKYANSLKFRSKEYSLTEGTNFFIDGNEEYIELSYLKSIIPDDLLDEYNNYKF